jgi:4-amino-4-deoxy-L-arabinose transferase-like glycosyltransferase
MSSGHANHGRWRAALFTALGIFLLTRFLTLTALPIFNDEAIYLQYSQRIHESWEKNKFISMNGEFTDWKPPLQYWLAAPFIEWGNDPLVVGRIVALLVSVAGFFGIYLFSKELFGEREGVVAAALYVLCPPALLHNGQFTAETFLFSSAALVYWALLKAMRWNTLEWVWAIVAAFFGTALLLFKQSGFSLLAISVILPLARLPQKDIRLRQAAKQVAWDVGLVATVICISLLAANTILPSEFNATRDHFNHRWVISLPELAALPLPVWRANLKLVTNYIGSSYSWAVPLLFCVFTWLAVRRRHFAELAIATMCLAGGGAVTFLLRGFNEYLFNTAVIAVLLPLLARTIVFASEFARESREVSLRLAVLVLSGLALSHWIYHETLMTVSPGKYFEQSTPWAAANYLKSWSTGFGVKEIVKMLEKEKRPGIVVADPQWGNPRTALEVYRNKRFPNLQISGITREFLDRNEARKLKEFATRLGSVHFAIYSADTSEGRPQWQTNVEEQMCEHREEIRAYPAQIPIIVCQF